MQYQSSPIGELLRRITGEARSQDTIVRVARELRGRHEGRHRQRRTPPAQRGAGRGLRPAGVRALTRPR